MYTPKPFVVDDRQQIDALIEANSFATLITTANGRQEATHLPLLLDTSAGEQGVLVGHIARANDQWRSGDVEALAIFSGPHAYISPSYYQTPNTVPTWNYVAVHVYGQLSFFDDEPSLRDVLRRTVAKYEQPRATPWNWDESTEYSTRLLRDIVGLRLTIERIEGKWKLNQNHPAERRQRVIAALEERGSEMERDVAALMREV